jgi:hypothetical protein
VVGAAIDGATVFSIHYYCTVFVTTNMVRVFDFIPVANQRTKRIIKNLFNCHSGSLCRPPAQLTLVDVDHQNGNFDAFQEELSKLISWLICNKDHNWKIKGKVPMIVKTRWNTIYSAVSFLLDQRDAVNATIQGVNERKRFEYSHTFRRIVVAQPNPVPEHAILKLSPIEEVPESWTIYQEALQPIAVFTTAVEGNLLFQQHVYCAMVKCRHELQVLINKGNPLAGNVLIQFNKRFDSTADGNLAELAFRLTPDGKVDWEENIEPLFVTLKPDSEEFKQLAYRKKEMKRLFCEFAGSYYKSQEISEMNLARLFYHWLASEPTIPGDDPGIFWTEKALASRNSTPSEWSGFSIVAKAIITLPATEAVCERLFSQVKAMETDYNEKMKPDLVQARARIKMAVRYRAEYPSH